VGAVFDVVIETERLRLRPYRQDDLDDLAAMFADPVHMEWYPSPFSREMTQAWIDKQFERYEHDGFGLFVVEELDGDGFAGTVGPSIQEVDGERLVEIGWHIRPGLKERGWIFFIHAIDDQGNIVVNKQISFDIQDQASPDETIRFNTISFATAPREAARRLAVGFYRPGLGQLRADKGVRDWNGGRVIVPAP